MPKSCKSRSSIANTPGLFAGPAAVLGVAMLLLFPAPAGAQGGYTPAEAVNLPHGQKVTAFGSSYDDWVIQLYFLADRTNRSIDVVDTKDGPTQHTVIAQLPGEPPFAGISEPKGIYAGPNGVVTVNHNELWVGDYDTVNMDGVVKVFDLSTGATTHMISTGGLARAGTLCADPNHDLVLVANDKEHLASGGGAPFDTIISTTDHSVVAKITLDGRNGAPLATHGIGQCQWDETTGNFLQALPAINRSGKKAPGAVIEISTRSLSIVKTFTISIGDCSRPAGMALGPAGQALLGCKNPHKSVPSTVIISRSTGEVLKKVAGEDGAGEVWYDSNSSSGEYFLAIDWGANPHRLGALDPRDTAEPSYPTGKGTRDVAVDNIFNEAYVPIPSTADTDLCASVAISPGNPANGCIMVFTN